jgi:hypothetical protein
MEGYVMLGMRETEGIKKMKGALHLIIIITAINQRAPQINFTASIITIFSCPSSFSLQQIKPNPSKCEPQSSSPLSSLPL